MLHKWNLQICVVFSLIVLSAWACDSGPSGYTTSESRNATPGTPATGGAVSDSQADRNREITPADREFVTKASSGNRHEVELGRLALERASNPDVRSFAERMVQDHSLAYDEITQLALRQNVNVPTQDDVLFKEKVEQLSRLKGPEFDREYMTEMLKDHVEDVGEFEEFSTSGQNENLRNWATRTLPTLREHLQMAQTIAPRVGAVSGGAQR